MRIQLCWIVVSILVLFLHPVIASAFTIIPADKQFVRSLDGKWHFRLEQDGDYPDRGNIGAKGKREIVLPTMPIAFETLNYREDKSWQRIDVPGNWEMAGFSPATYHHPDNAIGLYRLEFDVPAEWKDRIVKLNFDGVQNGAEVYCNGEAVEVDEPSEGRPNFHQGGFTAFQADLTPKVKFGQKNLLAVRAYKNTKWVDLDTGDYFFLGGIHRSVTLFSVPKIHVEDLTVQTKVSPDNHAELRLMLKLSTPRRGVKATMQLAGEAAVSGESDEQGQIELTQNLTSPKLWSAEHPNLYDLTIDIENERVVRRIGIREVSIKGGILLINNVPVKFTGMCRHDCWPDLGTALNEQAWRKDIELMKAANVNAIRTSHYPYGSGFYDLCDELGMYVMDEMAACWVPTNTDELTPAFQQHARELVRRDKNHPSVVVWAIGNENKKGKNNRIAADEIRKMDSTRPRLVSWMNAEEGNVELDDAHYTPPAKVAEAARQDRRAKYPKIYLENPNDWDVRNGADYGSLDLWAAVIDRTWKETWDAEHIAGQFLWEWQDRAVADLCSTKLYDYDPVTGINLAKVKGICDAFRNPRADYFHVKMAYAPIKVDLAPKLDGTTAIVHATNYLSFTDLLELTTTWRLMRGEKDLRSGQIHPKLSPRSRGDIKIDLPVDALAQADVLKLEFAYANGQNIANYRLRLKPEADTTPKIDSAHLAGIRFPRINLVPVTQGQNAIGWHWTFRHPAGLANIIVQNKPVKDDAALYAMALADVPSMEADIAIIDEPNAAPAGHVHVECTGGKFSYQISWSREGDKKLKGTDIQELGWVFEMSALNDHFTWHRSAYWSDYPTDHIGRPSGTATPDSSDVRVTKITRADAFDFNSTKYNCDWATLADSSGNGIAVSFAPDARQHCRGGTSENGQRQLVVNKYCAPPRDISSDVVPDFYFVLPRDGKVEGSFTIGAVGTVTEAKK